MNRRREISCSEFIRKKTLTAQRYKPASDRKDGEQIHNARVYD